VSILTNKHFIVAMLVTPILAVLAYFLTDYLVSERPHAAEQGASYKLIAKPNCRYTSGKCELKNGDFLVTLKPERPINNKIQLKLDANFSLDGVKIAMSQSPGASPAPKDMQVRDERNKQWQLSIDQPSSESNSLRLVISARGSLYFADVTTIFFDEDRPYEAE
jgi:hypothetical protein